MSSLVTDLHSSQNNMFQICRLAEMICVMVVVAHSYSGHNYFPTFYWDTGSSQWLYLFATSCDYCMQLLPPTINSFNSTLFGGSAEHLNNSISGINDLSCDENDADSLSFATRKCITNSQCQALQHFMFSLNSPATHTSIIHCTIGYSLNANEYYGEKSQNSNTNAYNDSTYELYLVTTLNMSINIVNNKNNSNINVTFLNTHYYEQSPSLFEDLDSSHVYANAPLLSSICYFAKFAILQKQQFDSIESIDRHYNYNYTLLDHNMMIVSFSNNIVDYSTFYWYMEPPYCDVNFINTTEAIPFKGALLVIIEDDVQLMCRWEPTVCLHKPLPDLINENNQVYKSAIVNAFSEFEIYYSGFNKNNHNNIKEMNIWSAYEIHYAFYKDNFYRRVSKIFDQDFHKKVIMKTGYHYWNIHRNLYNVFLWNLSDMNTLLCFVISCEILNVFLIYGFCINVYAYLKGMRTSTDKNKNNDNDNNSDSNNMNNIDSNNDVEIFGSTMGQLYLLIFFLWFPWFIIAYFLSAKIYYSFTGDYSDYQVEEGQGNLHQEILYFNRVYLRDYLVWTLFVFPSIIFVMRLLSVHDNSYDCIHCYTKYTKLKIDNSCKTNDDKKQIQSCKLKCVKYYCNCQYCIEKPLIWKFYLFFCAIIGPIVLVIVYNDQWTEEKGPGVYVWTLAVILFLIQVLPSLCMISKYCIIAWLYFVGILLADYYELWGQIGIIINFICVPLLFASNKKYKSVSFSILGMLIGLLDITTDLNLLYQWYFIEKYYIWAIIQSLFIIIGQIAASYFIGRKNDSIKSNSYLTQTHCNNNTNSHNDHITKTDRIFTLLGFGRVFLGVKSWTSRQYQLRRCIFFIFFFFCVNIR